MLVLSRKEDQALLIGDIIKVTVIKIQGNSIRLGIEAPEDLRILRGELAEWHELSVEEADLDELASDLLIDGGEVDENASSVLPTSDANSNA